jgi:hypothetical protein
MRVSDTERDRAIDLLRRRCQEGYLSVDTFAGRMDAVFAARDRRDVESLLADLPPAGLLGRLARALAGPQAAAAAAARWRREPTLTLVGLPLSDGASIVLGRSRSCDVTLGHDTVSRRHAELTMDGDRWTILDLGSTNGTWLGSARVHRAYVQSGTVVGLGALPVQLY